MFGLFKKEWKKYLFKGGPKDEESAPLEHDKKEGVEFVDVNDSKKKNLNVLSVSKANDS